MLLDISEISNIQTHYSVIFNHWEYVGYGLFVPLRFLPQALDLTALFLGLPPPLL